MKRNPVKARYLSLSIMTTGTIIGLTGTIFKHETLIIVCVMMLILGIFVNIAFYICPYCKGHLGRDSVEVCPHCGRKIK